MAEANHHGISARLWRLPGQFLLALINATSILVIIASVLALVVTVRVERFGANVVATTTEAVLSKIDLPSRDALANIRELTGQVRALAITLREIKEGENAVLRSEIARLNESLTVLIVSVDRLGGAKSILTGEVAARLGDRITNAFMSSRRCSSDPGSNPPRRARNED